MPSFRKKYLLESGRIFLYCIFGSAATTFFTCSDCRYNRISFFAVWSFTTAIWFVMWMGNGWMANYVGRRISWVDFPIKRLIVGIITTLAYSITAVSILIFIFEFLFNFNFGDYTYIIISTVIVTFVISTIIHSREFLLHWKESTINAEKFEKESIRAQYESLKSQVNPHFLFNSLNALTSLVYEDQDRAAKFIKQLSDVYRYVLDTREKDVVALEEEVEFLHSYIYMQQIRFGKNLIVEIDLADTKGEVAPLALQLLTENAIKHNIVSRDEPLTIRIFESDGYITVENNLQKKMTPDETLSGLGLENIRKRYAFLTDKKILVQEDVEKFVVRVPVINVIAA